jgi:UDPglucose--hexose-1-phosphate uridylyltransferase
LPKLFSQVQKKEDTPATVVEAWQKEYLDLGSKPFINHVQIFENKGAIMGCGNPHPPGQIWAQNSIPQEAAKKRV